MTQNTSHAVRGDWPFAPLVPLCAPRADGFEQIVFPSAVLPRLWRALKQAQPKVVALAVANLSAFDSPDIAPPCYDQLCREAAAAMQAKDEAFEPVIALLDGERAGQAQLFAGYLAILPLARRATARLPAWIKNIGSWFCSICKTPAVMPPAIKPRTVPVFMMGLAEIEV